MSELVEDLELWLDAPAYVDTGKRGREIDRASWLIQRARDEIVALREMRDAHIRILSASLDDKAATRDAALEEAAQRCDRLATDYTIPVSADNWSAGCRGCAGRIRALKGQAR